MSVEKDPRRTFNWTTEKVETCDSGSSCQESLLMINAGKARKGSWVGWEEGYVLSRAVSPPLGPSHRPFLSLLSLNRGRDSSFGH